MDCMLAAPLARFFGSTFETDDDEPLFELSGLGFTRETLRTDTGIAAGADADETKVAGGAKFGKGTSVNGGASTSTLRTNSTVTNMVSPLFTTPTPTESKDGSKILIRW